MPKPGALLPSGGIEYSLPATDTGNPPSHAAFRILVTTAGHLKARYDSTPDSEVNLYYTAGLFFEPGSFVAIWKPVGSTLVTLPADTVIVLNA